ncbi:MAG: hypothetical protein MZV64_72605 [Ignavibacteriales bacterium]|nr:hypothetical protein [Ignavibacteriales bacterium]
MTVDVLARVRLDALCHAMFPAFRRIVRIIPLSLAPPLDAASSAWRPVMNLPPRSTRSSPRA